MDRGEATDQLARSEAQAAGDGMRFAVSRVEGDWRAGLLRMNELRESMFVLHALRQLRQFRRRRAGIFPSRIRTPARWRSAVLLRRSLQTRTEDWVL